MNDETPEGSARRRRMRSESVLARLGAAAAVLTLAAAGTDPLVALTNSPAATEDADLAFVVDTAPMHEPGCEVVSVVDISTGRAIAYSDWRISPGRLALTGDAELVLSLGNDQYLFTLIMRRTSGEPPRWSSAFANMDIERGGPIAVSPDDSVILVALTGGVVAKYETSQLRASSLGRASGRWSGPKVASIVFANDSRTAYFLDVLGQVHIVDVGSMSSSGEPLQFAAPAMSTQERLRHTYATLSRDGRFIVTNTGRSALGVIDLVERCSSVVDAPGLNSTLGVAFDYVADDDGLLAVNGHDQVGIYAFQGTRTPILLGLQPVPAQYCPSSEGWTNPTKGLRFGAIAWSARGDAVIAAIGGAKEFRVLDVVRGTPLRLSRRLDFDSCTQADGLWFGQQIDVITLNRPQAAPRPTTGPSAVPSPPPPTVAPTASATSTGEVPTTATLTPRPPATACPTPALPPRAAYIPLALREQCLPGKQRADVALAIDASTTMRDDLTSARRSKLSAAIEAASALVDTMALPQDQAAVVIFNDDAAVLQGLTGRRADIALALDRIPQLVRKQTRIDCGIEVAHRELASARHKPQNLAVLILLTDGLANPVPASIAVERAREAKDDHITIFAIGLGKPEQLDVAELELIATRPEYFYLAPDGEDLRAIYQTIAVEIPCPAEGFWGRR